MRNVHARHKLCTYTMRVKEVVKLTLGMYKNGDPCTTEGVTPCLLACRCFRGSSPVGFKYCIVVHSIKVHSIYISEFAPVRIFHNSYTYRYTHIRVPSYSTYLLSPRIRPLSHRY